MSDGRGGRRLELERHDLDPAQLRRIAERTGGRFFEARTGVDLVRVYDDIDQLERIEREAPPRQLGGPIPEPFLAAAGGLLTLQVLLGHVFARRLP